MSDLNDAIQSTLPPGVIVTKSIVVFEMYDGETKSLRTSASVETPIWDMVGMLRCVLSDAQAFYVSMSEADDGEE